MDNEVGNAFVIPPTANWIKSNLIVLPKLVVRLLTKAKP